MKSRQIILPVLSALIFTAAAPEATRAGDVVLVANQNVPVATLSRHEVKNIFLSNKKNVGGVTIKLSVLKDDDLTKRFLKTYVGKTPSQFSNYYKKLVFTGKGKPPKFLGSEAELIAYVTRTSGAMGYVSDDADSGRVKIIEVKD